MPGFREGSQSSATSGDAAEDVTCQHLHWRNKLISGKQLSER